MRASPPFNDTRSLIPPDNFPLRRRAAPTHLRASMMDSSNSPEAQSGPPAASADWFCVRSQVKHEHIAAAHLQKLGLDVFLPRIRYRKATRRGPVWFNEALFPGYLFARFVWHDHLGEVMHARGVSTVIHFGRHWPVIREEEIQALRALAGDESLFVVNEPFEPGEEVAVSAGPFQGLTAVVQRFLPSRQRVAVLLEFLGRQTQVEIEPGVLVRERDNPRSGVA